jgi:hypothetical protein
VSRVEHALGELFVGNSLPKQPGNELLGQASRAEPYARLDSGILAREFRTEPRLADG